MQLETPPLKASLTNEPARRHPRVLFSIPIALRYLTAGGVRTARGMSLDISEGGMGALVEGALHVGDAVTIDLDLPAGRLDVVAMVRHTSSVRSGFEFLGLSMEERESIARAAPQVRQHSGLPVIVLADKPRPPGTVT